MAIGKIEFGGKRLTLDAKALLKMKYDGARMSSESGQSVSNRRQDLYPTPEGARAKSVVHPSTIVRWLCFGVAITGALLIAPERVVNAGRLSRDNHQRPATFSLHLTRTFAAPSDRVFHLWTDPIDIKRWFLHRAPLHWSPDPTVEAKVGGHYRIRAIRDTNESEVYEFVGTYRVVRAPWKLVFTWEWTKLGDLGPGDTLVTVDLSDQKGMTKLQLTQQYLPNSASLEAFRRGWSRCFDGMEALLQETR